MCFEILGFDVMLDEELNPYILEINHDPSFETDAVIDFKVKRKLIQDTI
jgi:tubulin polyglutamylase TTLL6/13